MSTSREPGEDPKNAYATLLTRPSYLAGAILLAYSLNKHSPSTPLVILYTPETLPEPCIKALEAEAHHSNCIPHPIDHLRLPPSKEQLEKGKGMVAERFIDTWTKLRVFELHELGFEKVCFLDADMLILSDPSPKIFDVPLDHGEVRASHVCVCNLDGDAWAPKDWTVSNCAYTGLSPTGLAGVSGGWTDPRGMMNTGTFVFRSTPDLAQKVHGKFKDTPDAELHSMKFPDQDFLNLVFERNWRPVHWSTNALKTWRNWHPNFWRDDAVSVLHYIVDKPWAKRIGADGKAGYKGLDGETHSWWWREFSNRKNERKDENELLAVVGKYVDGEGSDNEELRAIGGGAQDYAKRWDDETAESGAIPKRPLGEHGHGPIEREHDPALAASANEPVLKGEKQRIGKGGRGQGAGYMAD